MYNTQSDTYVTCKENKLNMNSDGHGNKTYVLNFHETQESFNSAQSYRVLLQL